MYCNQEETPPSPPTFSQKNKKLITNADFWETIQRAEAAAPAIQRLNPRVAVHIDTSKISEKDTSYFGQFDITIATELDLDSLIYINNACRTANRPFYAAASYGLYGYVFADLIKHTFVMYVQTHPTHLK